MRERPELDRGQHRMLEPEADVARHIGGDQQNRRRDHQRKREMAHPDRRRPELRRLGRAPNAVAIGDHQHAGCGDERVEAHVRPLADPRDDRRARIALRGEGVRADEDNEAGEHQKHGSVPLVRARRKLDAFPGPVTAGTPARSRERFSPRGLILLPLTDPRFRGDMASPHLSEGDGAPSGATSVLFAPRSRGAAPRGAPSGDFAPRAALFVRQSLVTASPSASSSRGLLVVRGGVPERPECAAANRARGRRSRPHIGRIRMRPSWIETRTT